MFRTVVMVDVQGARGRAREGMAQFWESLVVKVEWDLGAYVYHFTGELEKRIADIQNQHSWPSKGGRTLLLHERWY